MKTLRVSVLNFGPIEEGTVDIKPLTVFLGKNNTGKSYFAMLAHTFMESLLKLGIPYRGRRVVFGRVRAGSDFEIEERFSRSGLVREIQNSIHAETLKDIEKLLKSGFPETREKLTPKQRFEIPKETVEDLFKSTQRHLESGLKSILVGELERVFGCSVHELCSHDKELMRICFHLDKSEIAFTYEKSGTNVRIASAREIPKAYIVAREEEPALASRVLEDQSIEISFAKAIVRLLHLKEVDFIVRALIETLISRFVTFLIPPTSRTSFYLPAARSGILSAHKVLASGLLRQLRYVGLRKMEVLPLSGTITDFLASILEIQKRQGEYYELATFLEKQITGGEIDVRQVEKFTYPEIFYNVKKMELPLHRSSSMVSEMAPFVLYLKYVLVPDSALVIEEPESHLHPEAQTKLARVLTRLANQDMQIIMTSHSDYLYRQIQNLILLADLPEKKQKKLGFSKEDGLSRDKACAYLFKTNESGMTSIKPVDFLDSSMEDSGFSEIVSELYGQSVIIDRALRRKD